jgi:GNAT superfamily N-acetyltransferase
MLITISEGGFQVRGLRLYVRPIEPADRAALERFLGTAAGQAPDRVSLQTGLLGKLLGDIVAVVALEVTDEALRIEDIVVARDLRRKWIGRAMLREVEQLAAKFERRRIVVDDARDAQEFFRRTGFVSEGDRWVRQL